MGIITTVRRKMVIKYGEYLFGDTPRPPTRKVLVIWAFMYNKAKKYMESKNENTKMLGRFIVELNDKYVEKYKDDFLRMGWFNTQ